MVERRSKEDRELLAAVAVVWAAIDQIDAASTGRMLGHVADLRRELVDLLAGLPTMTTAEGDAVLSPTYLSLFASDLRRAVERFSDRLARALADDLTQAADVADSGFRDALSTYARAIGVPPSSIVLRPLGTTSALTVSALAFNQSAVRSLGERIAATASLNVQRVAFGGQSLADAVSSVRAGLATGTAHDATLGRMASQAVSIGRTGVYSIANASADHAMQESVEELPDLGMEWQAVLDRRTDTVCRNMDGERRPVGGMFPGGLVAPPLHTGCRCRLLPVLGWANQEVA